MFEKFNQDDWKYQELQVRFFNEVLQVTGRHPNSSIIESTLIDILLSMLINSDQSKQTKRLLSSSFSRIEIMGRHIQIQLRPNGTEYIINCLKSIIETTKVSMSSFFTIEARSSNFRE